MHKNKTKEPLFHIAKRAALPWYLSWAIRIGAIVLALVACAALTVFLTHENPFQVYATMFRGAFSTARRIWNLLQSLAMLLCVSLALTPAFKMRFWNIGGEGQVLIGGLATAACMIYLGGKIPNALLILTMIVASMLAGAIWALIPAFFKAQYNTNETLFTLMMNYVAIQLVAYFVIRWEVPRAPANRYYQPDHPRRLAAGAWRARLFAEYSDCGSADRHYVDLPEVQQARLRNLRSRRKCRIPQDISASM